MQSFLDLIKKIIPRSILQKIRPVWHGFLTYAAAVSFGFPARKMIVVGVTGTAGKSTTIQMLSKILNSAGRKTGFVTTVSYFDGSHEYVNPDSMSMPGKFRLQGYLKQMFDNGCTYAIIEATSEGLNQNRHFGIDFDMCLLTNIDEAHIEAHGGFVNYRNSKGKLFSAIARSVRKNFFPQKFIGLNLDSRELEYFAGFKADKRFGVTFRGTALPDFKIYNCEKLSVTAAGFSFVMDRQNFEVDLAGDFNAQNAALAAAAANNLGIDLAFCAKALKEFKGAAGRMERIKNAAGKAQDFEVFVDYAPEPIAVRSALKALKAVPHKRIIHVFGSTGGHRDVRKRFEMGEISAQNSDVIIVTNDDVYDSDPNAIAENIKQGIDKVPENLRTVREVKIILDRRQALETAIKMAASGDVIIVTGKGSEQFISLPGNKTVPWSDKKVIQELLQ